MSGSSFDPLRENIFEYPALIANAAARKQITNWAAQGRVGAFDGRITFIASPGAAWWVGFGLGAAKSKLEIYELDSTKPYHLGKYVGTVSGSYHSATGRLVRRIIELGQGALDLEEEQTRSGGGCDGDCGESCACSTPPKTADPASEVPSSGGCCGGSCCRQPDEVDTDPKALS
jgi:hypothetical protein